VTVAEPVEEFVYYSSCKEARKAGAAPLTPGDKGWNPDLDRDNDGIACE
jgi:micrococcal nuclease